MLAILHFNENLKRQPMKTKEGKPYYHVVYPKFKYGEEVVRQVAIASWFFLVVLVPSCRFVSVLFVYHKNL